MCANTALVTFAVDLNTATFTPVTTLPGRWEAPSLFRDPSDPHTLYMMCSGQVTCSPRPTHMPLSATHVASGRFRSQPRWFVRGEVRQERGRSRSVTRDDYTKRRSTNLLNERRAFIVEPDF